MIATKNALTSNERLPEPANVHADITHENGPKDILRLTKYHDTVWAVYHVQEAATEVGVSMLGTNVEAQYLVKLNKWYMGFRNQTLLSILVHLIKTWVKV